MRLGKWWRLPESNWGHVDFQSTALPTELKRQRGEGSNIGANSLSSTGTDFTYYRQGRGEARSGLLALANSRFVKVRWLTIAADLSRSASPTVKGQRLWAAVLAAKSVGAFTRTVQSGRAAGPPSLAVPSLKQAHRWFAELNAR